MYNLVQIPGSLRKSRENADATTKRFSIELFVRSLKKNNQSAIFQSKSGVVTRKIDHCDLDRNQILEKLRQYIKN